MLVQTIDDPLSDFRLDLRLLFKQSLGPLRFEFDPTLTWTGGDAVQVLSGAGLPIDQLPGSDRDRYFDWSDELFGDDKHRLISRIDRLSVAYRQPSWSIQLGRQAISWGSGLVFQPLDLFSPFAPTTIDREFKPGVDALLVESLVGESDEVQLLWIARDSEDPQDSPHTAAFKWHSDLNELSFDFIVAKHIGDEFAAISLAFPVFGSLLRIESSRLCEEERCWVNGLVNLDHTLSVGPALVYMFGELFHSGFGVDEVSREIPAELAARLARGELFTLMSNYGSFGLNLTWHPLWSQTIVLMQNLEDQSGLFQTSMNYEPSDASRMQFGFTVPFGNPDSEFGKRTVHDELTSGSGPTWFVSLAYYL